jgi:hypothetical protein
VIALETWPVRAVGHDAHAAEEVGLGVAAGHVRRRAPAAREEEEQAGIGGKGCGRLRRGNGRGHEHARDDDEGEGAQDQWRGTHDGATCQGAKGARVRCQRAVPGCQGAVHRMPGCQGAVPA